ncbi:MAG: hypothetical protein MUF64_05650 [Polyangiaceae bacterium]|nr:hypothetical protein [Polyangiaceae bacterium]
MSLSFAPFDKIAERPDQWQADEIALRRLARLPWVVSEKIHGANLCIAVEPAGLRVGKRKRWLEPNEDFFGHHRLLARLRPSLLELARLARQGRDQVASVLVYGELFGGSYPHPQVTPVAEVEPVQTGVWYAPDVHLCIFDLALRFEQGDRMEFLDIDRTLALAGASGLLAAEPLLVGSYREAMDFCERFPTTLPTRLGLPSLGPSNLAEGVVLRPQRAVTLDTPRGPVRPLLKKKIDEFAEDERYRGARPWARTVQGTEPVLNRLEQEALSLLTPTRVAAAVSKVGRQDPQGIAEETLGDLWEEIQNRTPVLAY